MSKRILDTLEEHVKKYGPQLNYVSFPDGFDVLTEEGKRKLDGDTLSGHIEITYLQSQNSKLIEALEDIAKINSKRTNKEPRLGVALRVLKEIKGDK